MPIELPAVRILIVDDDRQICDYMQMLLEKDGFAVTALTDPTLAEAEIRSGRYTLTSAALKSARRAGQTLRDCMLSVPGRVAAQLAAMDDERQIDQFLSTILREELGRLAATVAPQGDGEASAE